MILNSYFDKQDLKECRNRTYLKIGLDALFYDAQQNVRVSIQSLYFVYIDVQHHKEKPLPELINHWVIKNLSQFFKGEIEATDLVSQSKNDKKSNKNNRFNPFLSNSRINLQIMDVVSKSSGRSIREILESRSKAGKRELNSSPGEYTKPQFWDVGIDSLQKDRTTLKKRYRRLKEVERLLDMYYQSDTVEKEQIILDHLKKHYSKSRSEQDATTNQFLI